MYEIISKQLNKFEVLSSDKHVLVYQMGKVGSAGISNTLDLLGIPNTHIHTFSDHEEFLIFNNHKDIKLFFNPVRRVTYKALLRMRLVALKRAESIRIITLVRDPIAVMVSRFFQDLHLFFPKAKRVNAIHRDNDVLYNFVENEFKKELNLKYFLNWFDEELKKNFGVDVYETEFNKEAGFKIIEEKGCKVLVVQMEKLDELNQVFEGYFNENDFKLVTTNHSSDKWYSSVYRKFLNDFDFSGYSWVYDTKFSRHFYSDSDLNKFKERWDMN